MPGCAVGPDGNLLDAEDIQWYKDVDSSEPINLATTPSSSVTTANTSCYAQVLSVVKVRSLLAKDIV